MSSEMKISFRLVVSLLLHVKKFAIFLNIFGFIYKYFYCGCLSIIKITQQLVSKFLNKILLDDVLSINLMNGDFMNHRNHMTLSLNDYQQEV